MIFFVFLVSFEYFFFEAVRSKFHYLALQAVLTNLTDGMGFVNIFDDNVFVDISFSCQSFGNLI